MLIDVNVAGNQTSSVDSRCIIRIRPSFGDYEPTNTVFIDYVSGVVYSIENIEAIREKFSPHVRLAGLHSPIGTRVFLNADGIAAIKPPHPDLHHDRARSIAIFRHEFINPTNPSRGQQQMHETQEQAMVALNGATFG